MAIPEFAELLDSFNRLVFTPSDTDRFRRLFAGYRELTQAEVVSEPSDEPTTDIGTFAELLTGFRDIVSREPRWESKPPTVSEAGSLFEGFESVWADYVESNARRPPAMNMWRVADLGVDEIRHCRVLRWLLDPHESHFQGNRFLRCLLCEMGESDILGDSDTRFRVRREVVESEGESRVDILVEARSFVLCIEAKTVSEEDTAQVDRYYRAIGIPAQGRGQRFLGKLLTPEGQSGEQVGSGFSRLLWRDVAAALKRFSGQHPPNHPLAAQSEFVRALANQYALFIEDTI